MEMRKPSRTAVNTAVWRAVHTLLDDEPKILADPFARALAGFGSDEALLAAHDAHPAAHVPGIRAPYAVRNRYAEDELAEAVGRGIGQYVILGAGLDSFAYRRPDLMRSLDVFEVDHPATQAWKRARVAELGIEVPARLHHVPIDFERETLTEALAAGGLRTGDRAFFSWLGVTQYLTREAVERALGEIAYIAAPGSGLVVQFIAPASMLGAEEGALVATLAGNSAKLGEPWLSFFKPAEMEAVLRQAGFSSVEHFGPEEAHERYLRGRTDGSRVPGYFRMAKATTGPVTIDPDDSSLTEPARPNQGGGSGARSTGRRGSDPRYRRGYDRRFQQARRCGGDPYVRPGCRLRVGTRRGGRGGEGN
jgi:methyltransferase (TIGR00027 family)